MNQESPNPLTGEQSPNMRPTSPAAYGSALDSGAGEHAHLQKVSRVLRVQLLDLTYADWLDLLFLSRESAQFCNATLADHFARDLGYVPPNGESVFRRFAGRLSGDVRVALGREAFTQWRMHKYKVLRGEQRLAFFGEKRSLVCRAEHMSKGKRQRHGRVEFSGSNYYLNIRLVGKSGERIIAVNGKDIEWGKKGERHRLKLWWKPQVDERIAPVMDGLASGETRLLKVSFVFKRPGRKIYVLLAYEKIIEIPESGAKHATLGPLEQDGTLWLRIDGERPHNYTHWIHELLSKKEHFEDIVQRIRLRTKRSGPKHRQAYRHQLLKAGNFSNWAHGRLHQMSADIVKKLLRADVGCLTVAPMSVGELPMYELEEKLKYKLQEIGITLDRLDPKDKTTEQAFGRILGKREGSAARAKKALRTLRQAVERRENT
jgi:hypothetical protein